MVFSLRDILTRLRYIHDERDSMHDSNDEVSFYFLIFVILNLN